MDWLFKHLFSLPIEIQVIFFGILAGGLVAYLHWAHPKLKRTQDELSRLADTLEGSKKITEARQKVDGLLQEHPLLKGPWDATQTRVIAVGEQERTRFLLLNGVDDLWRPERLLHKQFNFALFEAVPNIAVGVGLLFTFVFLTLALTDATAALSSATGKNANLVEATRNLLSSAGGKFMSSLAGLFVSLMWTVVARRQLVRLERAASRVVDAIEVLWPPLGAEAVVMDQLAQLKQVTAQLVAQHGVQVQVHKGQEELVGLTDELLLEAKEQTGSLKRFETDLAISIGNAITNSFGPQMEQMTARLEQAITRLSDRIGSMNEDALRKMLEQFSSSIRDNTGKEMDSFKATLTDLSEALALSAGKLQEGVGGAAISLGEASKDMHDKLGASAASLVESVDAVKALIDHTNESVRGVDAAVTRAAELGAQGVEQLARSLSRADEVIGRVGDAGQQWQGVTAKLEAVSGDLADVCDGMEELSHEQKAVVNSVKATGPEVLQAVDRVRGLLVDATGQAAQSMGQVQTAMERTSRELTGVVSSITTGVSEYSKQLGDLHHAMDQEMAKAVGSLGGVIQHLDDTVGELTDSLDEFDRKR
jgi:ABC-type transporter Mla subunit MlaD